MEPPIEVEISVRDDVVQFLTSAQSTQNSSERLQWCQSIEEVLLRRTDVDDNERTALLHEFVKPIMELHLNASRDVKIFVIKFAQAIAIDFYEHLKDILPSFYALSQDENDLVLRTLLQSGVHVYRRSLRYIADTDVSEEVRTMYALLESIKHALLSQLSSKNDVNRCAAIKFVECLVLTHSDLTRDDPNMVKTSAKSTRGDNDGADTFHLRHVPTTHELLKKNEMRKEGRSRLEDLLRRCCQTCGSILNTKKKKSSWDQDDEEDSDDDDSEAPQVEYDVSFSKKNIIIAINCCSGIGTHRAKLVDIIFPGMLSIHQGAFSNTAMGKKSKTKTTSNDGTDCIWNEKQAKSITNINKNNMLKLLKFTSSVPWHEELVEALCELGAKEKAIKAQEMSQEAAISVTGHKHSRASTDDLDDYSGGRYVNTQQQTMEVYNGPWPVQSSTLILPKDYSTGLKPKQILGLLILNMKHLPPPPPADRFPGEVSNTTADEKSSLDKLIKALDRMAKFTQHSIYAAPMGPPPSLTGAGWGLGGANQAANNTNKVPLKTPNVAVFDRHDPMGGVVAPFKRLLRSELVISLFTDLERKKKEKRDSSNNEDNANAMEIQNMELIEAGGLHSKLMGRIVGIAKILHQEEKKADEKKGKDKGEEERIIDDPSGLENVLVELVGKIDSTDIPEDVIFNVVNATLYRHFYELCDGNTLSETSGSSNSSSSNSSNSSSSNSGSNDSNSTPSLDEQDSSYVRFLVRIMRAMPMQSSQQRTRYDGTKDIPRLTRLLLECPMVPKIVLREVIDQWCEAAGESGDKEIMTVGLVTLRQLILHRSSLRSECLSAVFGYTQPAEGSPTILSDLSIKMTTNTLFNKNDSVDQSILNHVISIIQKEPSMIEASMNGEEPLNEQDANDRSKIRLIFFEKMCRKHPPLINDMLKSYVTVRADTAVRTSKGGMMYCSWVEEMAPKFAVNAVTLYERNFITEDREALEKKEADLILDKMKEALEGTEQNGSGDGDEDGDVTMKAIEEEEEEEEKKKTLPIVRGAVAMANLLKNAPTTGAALKPIVFILKALSAPSQAWKGPAPELVAVMYDLFTIFGSNYWILVFALPGMSKEKALNCVSNIVIKATIEKGKGAQSKGAQIMRGALDALLNPADLSFAPVTPSELLISLHLLVTTEAGKTSTSATMAAITYCIGKESFSERFTANVLKSSITELLNVVNGDASKLSKLFLRLLIQSVTLRPELKLFSLEICLKLIEMEIWTKNPSLWKGCLHLLPMFGEESYHTYLSLPLEVLTGVMKGNVKLLKSLSSYVKLSLDIDSKSKYDIHVIKLLENSK